MSDDTKVKEIGDRLAGVADDVMDFAKQQRVRNELEATQLEHIRNAEARQVAEHACIMRQHDVADEDNSPAHRREWHRHQVAVAAMSGVLQGGYPESNESLAANCYEIAEAMLLEREKRAASESKS